MLATRVFAVAAGLALAGCGLESATGADGDGGGPGGGSGGDLDPLDPPDSPFGEDPFPDDGTCGDINVVVNGLTPTVQLLIDQSGSMREDFGGTNRWNAVYRTLMGGDGVVPTLDAAVRFGLTLYTSDGGNAGGQCPQLVDVAPELDNFEAMDAEFGPAGPAGDTPTGESIDAVAQALAAQPADGPKIIVLGTDGEPDSCDDPNPETEEGLEAAQALSVAAAERAYDAGIRTFVVSVGSEIGEDHLQDMANAGVGLPVGGSEQAPYYVALDPEELVAAFQQIVGGVQGCVFTINGEVDPSKASQGRVALDGRELEYGSEWELLDGKTFEILGGACDTLQDGELHHVSAVFPCGAIDIDID